MAANKPIEIIIKDERGEETVQGGGGSNTNIQPDSMPNQQAKENKKASALQAAAMMVAMRSLSYASSNIGKWTGNSRNQVVADSVMKAAGYAAAFAANVYVGVATVALDFATTAFDGWQDNYWNGLKAQQSEARTGGKGGYRR